MIYTVALPPAESPFSDTVQEVTMSCAVSRSDAETGTEKRKRKRIRKESFFMMCTFKLEFIGEVANHGDGSVIDSNI